MIKQIFIIAEIGINHNGDLGIARDLIDVAVDAGADAVKFQKRTIDLVYTQDFLDCPRESPWGTTQREQKEGLEFGVEEYREIDKYCKEKGIEWFASTWDLESQKFLRQFNLKHNKIASAMIVYLDLLEEPLRFFALVLSFLPFLVVDSFEFLMPSISSANLNV